MLKIEHLTKTYGEKKAVDDLNLHIKPGEIYGFIGHNGAGKTTTLKSVVWWNSFRLIHRIERLTHIHSKQGRRRYLHFHLWLIPI